VDLREFSRKDHIFCLPWNYSQGSFFLTVTVHMIELFMQETEKKKREEMCLKDEDVS
jgi:hypothetical protein